MTSWSNLTLSEKDVQRLCGPTAFAEGDLFERRGHVLAASVLDESLTGLVRGHWRRVDRVLVTHDKKNALSSQCTCSWGRLCRHAAALMLLWVRQPQFVTRTMSSDTRGHPMAADDDFADEWLDEFGDGELVESPIDPDALLEQWLNYQPLTTLRTIASYWDVKLPGTKVAAVAKLRATMNDPDTSRAVVAALDADARLALDVVDLLSMGGASTYHEVQRAVGRMFGQADGSHPSPALRRLYDRALVISVGDRWGNATSVVLPPVAQQLGSLTGPLCPQVVTTDVPPSRGLTFSDVFEVLVDAVESGSLVPPPSSLTESGDIGVSGWHAQELETASSRDAHATYIALPLPVVDETCLTQISVAVGWSPDACEFAFRLLLILGIVRVPASNDEQRYIIDSVVWANSRELPLTELLPICVMGWVEASVGIELRQLLRGQPSLRLLWRLGFGDQQEPEFSLPDVVHLRDLLMRFIERLPVPAGDRWYRLDELHDTLWRLDRTVLGTDVGSRRSWWFATHPGGDLHLERRADWDRVVAPLLDIIVTGPMRTLGLVEVAPASDSDAFFRPTPVVARLGRKLPEEESAPTWHIWREGDDVLVTAPSRESDVNARRLTIPLMRYHNVTPEGLTYRISRDSLGWTLNLGWTLETVVAELEQRCDTLSDDVRTILRLWGDTFGDVRLYDEVSLVETEDELLLQELLRTTTMDEAVVRILSPRVAIVKSARVPDLIHEMERLGHAPRIVEGW